MKRNALRRAVEVWNDLEVAAVVLVLSVGLALAPIFEVRRLWNLGQRWLAFGIAIGYATSIAVTMARRRRGELGNWGVFGWILLSSVVVLVLGESLG